MGSELMRVSYFATKILSAGFRDCKHVTFEKELQGRTWREQAEASQKEVAACKQQLHEKLSSREQMKADCKRDAEEHVRLTIREQEIEYERKIQVGDSGISALNLQVGSRDAHLHQRIHQ